MGIRKNAKFLTPAEKSWPTGFDQWVTFPGQGLYQDPEVIANGMRLKMRGHADDVVGDQPLTVLRERPKDPPFCLLYHFKSPHWAWVPAARHEHAFDDVAIPVPRTFEDRLRGGRRRYASPSWLWQT